MTEATEQRAEAPLEAEFISGLEELAALSIQAGVLSAESQADEESTLATFESLSEADVAARGVQILRTRRESGLLAAQAAEKTRALSQRYGGTQVTVTPTVEGTNAVARYVKTNIALGYKKDPEMDDLTLMKVLDPTYSFKGILTEVFADGSFRLDAHHRFSSKRSSRSDRPVRVRPFAEDGSPQVEIGFS